MPRLNRICLALALCSGAGAAFAAATCVQDDAEPRVVEVITSTGGSAEAFVYYYTNGHWLIPVSALGYHADAFTLTCNIGEVPHTLLKPEDVASYDAQNQALTISENVRRRTVATLAMDAPAINYSPVELGLRSIVDFSLLKTQTETRASALVENSFRTQDWLFYNSLTVGKLAPTLPGTVLLDSYARKENLVDRTFVQIGDGVYQSNLTGRAARLTGVSLGRGIGINPNYLPYSYSAVGATSVVPSTLEIFINQQRVQRQEVDAGPFALSNLAGPIGYGEYRLVTRDALGRQQVTTQPFYNSAEIIRKGFLEHRVDIGRLRQNYGRANYEFGEFAAIGYLRYGITDDLTLGGQVMHSGSTSSVGVKPAFRFGTVGVVSGVLQLDRNGKQLWSVAGERIARRYSVRAEYERSSRGYRDALVDDRFPMPTQSLSLRGTYRMANGSISVSHLRSEGTVLGKSAVSTVSLQQSINPRFTLIATANAARYSNFSDYSLFVGGVFSFGKSGTALTSVTHGNNGTGVQSSLSQHPGAANGFGYDLMAANRSGSAYGQARGVWNTDLFRSEIETNTEGSMQLRMRTGAVATKEAVFLGRPSGDAFVLVDTNGMPRVEVVGPSDRVVTTNRKGFALFPGLAPNVPQSLALNVDELPLDVQVYHEQVEVVPPPKGIVRAKFKLAKLAPVLLYLTDTDGSPLPRGAVATIDGQEKRLLGSSGALYLESPAGVMRIEAQANGRTCIVEVTAVLANEQTLKATHCTVTK